MREQNQRSTVTTAFAGPGDRVPGRPRPAAGEPGGADAAGHGGHVPGGPGGPGKNGIPPPRGALGQVKPPVRQEGLEFLSSLILSYPLCPRGLPGEPGWALRSPRLCHTQSRTSSLSVGREEGPGPGSGRFHLLSPAPSFVSPKAFVANNYTSQTMRLWV